MAEVTGKTAAAAALKAMVEDRKTLVEALGEAIDHHRKAAAAVTAAQQAEADAAETVRTAYAASASTADGPQPCSTTPDLRPPRHPGSDGAHRSSDPLVGTGVADNLAPAAGH